MEVLKKVNVGVTTTTTRNLQEHMQELMKMGFDPVLSVEEDSIENYRYLRLMAINSHNEYDDMFCAVIYTSDGRNVKTVASKKTLYNFAKKYGFEPQNVVINGMLPEGRNNAATNR